MCRLALLVMLFVLVFTAGVFAQETTDIPSKNRFGMYIIESYPESEWTLPILHNGYYQRYNTKNSALWVDDGDYGFRFYMGVTPGAFSVGAEMLTFNGYKDKTLIAFFLGCGSGTFISGGIFGFTGVFFSVFGLFDINFFASSINGAVFGGGLAGTLGGVFGGVLNNITVGAFSGVYFGSIPGIIIGGLLQDEMSTFTAFALAGNFLIGGLTSILGGSLNMEYQRYFTQNHNNLAINGYNSVSYRNNYFLSRFLHPFLHINYGVDLYTVMSIQYNDIEYNIAEHDNDGNYYTNTDYRNTPIDGRLFAGFTFYYLRPFIVEYRLIGNEQSLSHYIALSYEKEIYQITGYYQTDRKIYSTTNTTTMIYQDANGNNITYGYDNQIYGVNVSFSIWKDKIQPYVGVKWTDYKYDIFSVSANGNDIGSLLSTETGHNINFDFGLRFEI